MYRLIFIGFCILFGLSCNPTQTVRSNSEVTVKSPVVTTIFLVRHAEKQSGKDPELTEEGHERAESLAEILRKVELDVIYSTDYRRTLQTAAPTAKSQGLEVVIYTPSDLEAFANQVITQHTGQTVLIVGHSNTTPTLTGWLDQSKSHPPFSEDDYGNLFVLTIAGGTSQLQPLTY